MSRSFASMNPAQQQAETSRILRKSAIATCVALALTALAAAGTARILRPDAPTDAGMDSIGVFLD